MLQMLTSPLTAFRAKAPALSGPLVARQDPCGLCQSREALLLSKADYWDLMEVDLVRCCNCGLIQVDPMLTAEATAQGCLALYRFQQSDETDRSRKRGLFRAFRRGVAFGVSLRLKGVRPKRVLEVGAGDGYFLRGLQFVFPQLRCTCLDVVDEILLAMQTQHGFETIHSSVEGLDPAQVPRFDLIVARDILEHVTKPAQVLATLAQILEPRGKLFFITPNGWQDAWQMFSRWQADHAKSELLINHVNYFDAVSLRTKLETLGFKIHDWFIYDLKTFSRGAGWRILENHKARRSVHKSAAKTIAETKDLTSVFTTANARPIPAAFESSILRPFLMFYCWWKHTSFVRVRPETRIGEEIYCLAEKVAP